MPRWTPAPCSTSVAPLAGSVDRNVQDALVRCKVLQNDGWKEIIGFIDDWAVDKARPRVEIEIVEMED